MKQALNFPLINSLKFSLKTLTIHQSSPTRQITSVESLTVSWMQFFLPHWRLLTLMLVNHNKLSKIDGLSASAPLARIYEKISERDQTNLNQLNHTEGDTCAKLVDEQLEMDKRCTVKWNTLNCKVCFYFHRKLTNLNLFFFVYRKHSKHSVRVTYKFDNWLLVECAVFNKHEIYSCSIKCLLLTKDTVCASFLHR